jgi:hypothetical protein
MTDHVPEPGGERRAPESIEAALADAPAAVETMLFTRARSRLEALQ